MMPDFSVWEECPMCRQHELRMTDVRANMDAGMKQLSALKNRNVELENVNQSLRKKMDERANPVTEEYAKTFYAAVAHAVRILSARVDERPSKYVQESVDELKDILDGYSYTLGQEDD
jgi:hypothetical protein